LCKFQGLPGDENVSRANEPTITEARGIKLLLKEKGIYEPSSLVKSKPAPSNSFSTSSTSSPSSSLESTARSLQAFNARAVQANTAQGIANLPSLPSPGPKSASSTEAWPSPKAVHEDFISAVLGSVVFFLCRDHGFVPLNSRTLILTSPSLHNPGIAAGMMSIGALSVTLATLDINLTSLGALVVKAHCDTAPGLQRVINPSSMVWESSKLLSGATLWLAPGGNCAKYYRCEDDKKMSPTLPISELQIDPPDHRQQTYMGVTIQSWKLKCLEWLSAKGLDATSLEDGGWIFVQILDTTPYLNADYPNPILEELTIVPWPALLCFQTANVATHEQQQTSLNHNGRDPLSFAEEWFAGKDDREATLMKRQKERQVAEARVREQAEVEARAIQPITNSPAALRRGSNAGAMYPTPPDAIHHPVGATPSFDYAASTPGNPNVLFVPEIDPSGQQNTNPETNISQADIWNSSSREERVDASVNFPGNDNDNDNLFEDGGDDLFGGITDVTDADFNFFDEPDDVEDDPPVQSSGEGVSEAQDISNLMDTAFNDTSAELPPINSDVDMIDAVEMEPSADLEKGVGIIIESDIGQPDKVPELSDTNEVAEPVASPPFDGVTVFKHVVQEQLNKRSTTSIRPSVFTKVDLTESILSVNERYSSKGRFNFTDLAARAPGIGAMDLPTTHSLSRRQKLTAQKQESGSFASIFRDVSELVDIPGPEDQTMPYITESDLGSQVSEHDDTSHTTDDLSLAFKPGMKRKWTMENEIGEDMTASFNGLAMDYGQSVGTPLSISGSQLPFLEGDPADWSLTTYFTSLEPDVHSNALSDLEYIATAQILADQAVSGTLKLPGVVEINCHASRASLLMTTSTKELMHALSESAKICVQDVEACSMRSYLDVQGIPALNQALRLPPRPITNSKSALDMDSKPNNIFPISPPRLEVRRSDTKLTVLPSAINFWENLGLGPSKGGKDVSAICVHPNIDGVAENAIYFLDQMRNIYESSRLGSHDRVVSKDIANSCVSYSIDPAQLVGSVHFLATLKETMGRLSKIFSSMVMDEKNIVVYFIYPVENTVLLVHICTAFHHLFNMYRRCLAEKKMAVVNDLVLQLVPLDMISSSTWMTLPLPSDYFRLATEVYDRCIHFASHSDTPAILLEQPLPRNIEFKLNSTPSSSLLQENSCLHVAYAQSIDDRWITAAWTDNRGTQQMTASYCLGRKNEPLSMQFSDIAHEIWETTLEILSKKKIHWRIMIARVGVMDPLETDFWINLASTESNAQISLALITVQTDPSLRLIPPSVTLLPNSSSNQSIITPVSTPQAMQASIMSPDTSANSAATPSENPPEPDIDARLIDFTDQSWGAVLSHRLNNSNSLLEINPALVSGYLIKRGGTNLEDAPIVMEVNVVHCELVGNPRTFHEGLLKEVLGYYRDLGTLARVRDMVDAVKDVRPWHVVAAEKAVKALYMLM
jgi:mediator of RNA polymerase II transcription subunit 13